MFKLAGETIQIPDAMVEAGIQRPCVACAQSIPLAAVFMIKYFNTQVSIS
jgi:hypothetical protein